MEKQYIRGFVNRIGSYLMIKTPLSTVIGGAFWTPKATIVGGTSKKTFNQIIQSLFANNEQGFAYDPNDMSTMFQDAAGVTPVTGVGQPVGLILDKSGRNNHAFQTTSASRPILRQNAITGANYLEFDGSDDFLQTNTIDLSFTDKFSLLTSVRKLNETVSVICEFGPTVNITNGTFGLISSTSSNNIVLRCRGSGAPNTFTDATIYNFLSPASAVLTGKIITQATKTSSLRVNGQIYLASLDSGVANLTEQQFNIGRRNGTNLPFNGHIYGLIGVSKLVSDIETAAIEKGLAKRTGVTLSV